MTVVLIAAVGILVIVFMVSSVAKLRDLPGTRKAIVDFGVPPKLAHWIAPLIPVTELITVTLLVLPPTMSWGAAMALFLLGIFTLAILANLLRGKRPDCHCFGQIHVAPIGWNTIFRNLFLIGAALLVLLFTINVEAAPLWNPTAFELMMGLLILLLAACLIQGWFIYQLLHQSGRLLVRMEAIESHLDIAAPATPAQPQGLPVGAPAPNFPLLGVSSGEQTSIRLLASSGLPLLLIFSDPNCGPCSALLPRIAQWQQQHKTKLALAVISTGDLEANRRKQHEHGLTMVYLQQARAAASAYKAFGTPSAVLLLPAGTIGSPLAAGEVAIANLVEELTGGERPWIPLRRAQTLAPAP